MAQTIGSPGVLQQILGMNFTCLGRTGPTGHRDLEAESPPGRTEQEPILDSPGRASLLVLQAGKPGRARGSHQ